MIVRARLLSLGLVVGSLAFVAGGLEGCGSSSDDAPAAGDLDSGALDDGSSPGKDGGPGQDAGSDAAVACPRTAAPADRPRKVVISHPFLESGDKATGYEVLDLSAAGELTRPTTPVAFSMGTSLDAPIVFTPDGEVGLVAQDDGSIGVFRMAESGGPVVVHAAFEGGFYAGGIVLAPDGSHGWVLDGNTGDNGGGVYEIAIGCDGTLTSRGLVIPGGGARAMALLPSDPTKALLAAKQAFDSSAGMDVHLVDLAAHKGLGSIAAFGDGDAIASSLAITPDGKNALVADNGLTAGNRIAVVALTPALAPVSILSTPYPAAVVTSPFGNAAIALNGDASDAIHVLSYDASKPAPFVITGELAYKFAKPELPSTASMIDRGALRGTVLVSENLGVRKLVFGADGTVTDVAQLAFPDGIANIVGVVGVQP
jgi:DNA-binding beta-propeller fold protein YncE